MPDSIGNQTAGQGHTKEMNGELQRVGPRVPRSVVHGLVWARDPWPQPADHEGGREIDQRMDIHFLQTAPFKAAHGDHSVSRRRRWQRSVLPWCTPPNLRAAWDAAFRYFVFVCMESEFGRR